MGNLYLECYSGISGDMVVGALLDLGADEKVLLGALESINLEGYHVKISRVKKAGIDACDFHVVLDKKHENNDHDMKYLHGEDHHEHNHSNEHSHDHRGINEVIKIINMAEISDIAKQTAISIFNVIAEAEAKAHDMENSKVSFHEVGAIDSIVDIIAVAVCLDNLSVTEVVVTGLYEGVGVVRCQHGVIPIPVPAVANIVSNHGINLHITEVEGELVTPTGAAIVAAVRTTEKLPDKFKILKIGVGAGKRNYTRPSMVRAMLIEADQENEDLIYKLESNIDDCTGENLGYVMDKLFAAGARDVHYTPVFMKKNRPAYQLNVICKKENIDLMEKIIFKETTTIGIRRVLMERTVLERKILNLTTSIGEAKVKVCEFENTLKYYPEYDSVVEICKATNLSFNEVFETIRRESEESWKK